MLATQQLLVLNDKCCFDLDQGDLIKNNLRTPLPKKEARLLYCLAQNLGHPVSQDVLISYIWGPTGMPFKNSLYQCVHRLRERLEDDVHHPTLLLPIKGYGYMLCPNNSPRKVPV